MSDAIEALVRIDDDSWLLMADPIHVVEARTPAEVAGTIREIETRATAQDCYGVGLVRYEAGNAFGLRVREGASELPLAWFALFERSAVRSIEVPLSSGSYRLGKLEPSIEPHVFRTAFERIKTHIADGDSYQINYTFRLRGSFEGDSRSFFADLAAAQGGRYAVFLRIGPYAVCSASPELFFSRHGPAITTRPMKGTVRRGRTLQEDREQAEWLRGSVKERAENVMIVDMMRNDLGRIAHVGTVMVPELFTLERYPNVWQMTSTVTARSMASLDQIFAAAFPSASVTGAPKVRTMEIIETIEREPRGVYTGAVGWVAPGGEGRFNVAIRTAVVDARARALEFGVGSGVVWDSEWEREYNECLLKGSILDRRPSSFELLETLRWTPGEGFFLLDRHLGRLRDSAEYFGFDCSTSRLREALDRAVVSADRALRVRLLAAEDGTVRTELMPLDRAAAPMRIGLAIVPIDPSDVFLFHKTTSRRQYERARRADLDDVILWNPAGEATESTVANLVVERNGRRVTPPVECGLLGGTFRAHLLARGDVVEERVRVDELRAASRVWLINSVRGWCPATLLAS